MKRDFFDFNSEFYKPLWVRLVIFGGCFGWGLFELLSGSSFWAIIFLSAGAWCFYGFFLKKPDDE